MVIVLEELEVNEVDRDKTKCLRLVKPCSLDAVDPH